MTEKLSCQNLTIPNLAELSQKHLSIINTLTRDHGVPARDAATIVLTVRNLGFEEGRDAALKSAVEIMEVLAGGNYQKEVTS